MQSGPRGILPSLAGIHGRMLQTCLFVRSTVVVSELLTSLPNLRELACVSCVNVFDEAQLSGVRSWYVFVEEDKNVFSTSYPLLRSNETRDDEEDVVSASSKEPHQHTKEAPTDSEKEGDASSDRSKGQRPHTDVVKTRTIAAVPLAVWSRVPIVKEDAPRFKTLPIVPEDQTSTATRNGEEFIDALGFYKHQHGQVRSRVHQSSEFHFKRVHPEKPDVHWRVIKKAIRQF